MAQATVESIIPDNHEAPSLFRRTRLLDHLLEQVTFFRVHPFAFTFIPLIFSGIFYASNGRYHVSYVDALFLCYSAMTVTGLSTVDLSTTTGWQQAILYFFNDYWRFYDCCLGHGSGEEKVLPHPLRICC